MSRRQTSLDPESDPSLKVQRQVALDDIPAEEFILDGIDVSREPHFGPSEVSKFFFARSAHWVRWAEDKGFLALDSKKGCPHSRQVRRKVVGSGGVVSMPLVKEWLYVDGVCPLCGGVAVGDRRTDAGSRVYTLADVEKMAHALADHDAIDVNQLKRALTLVTEEATLWGYLPRQVAPVPDPELEVADE